MEEEYIVKAFESPYKPTNMCPNVEEDCWTDDEGEDFMIRECKDCGFSTGGDYQNMEEYWEKGISNIQ